MKETTDRLSILANVAELAKTIPDLGDLLCKVTRVVHEAADTLDITIGLLDEESGCLVLQGGAGRYERIASDLKIPHGSGIAAWVAEHGKLQVSNDVSQDDRYLQILPNTRSQLTIPLLGKSRVLGVFVAESEEKQAFLDEDIRVLKNLCHFISSVIENAHLYETLSRNSATLATLFEVATEMSSILDLDVLFEKVSQLLGRVVEHELFALLLVDEERKQFIWESGVGYSDAARQHLQRLELNQGICGRVYRDRQPLLVPDVASDPDYVAAETVSGRAPVSALAVPLIFQDRVMGVLILESTARNSFSAHHRQIVAALATQMAIAIENAQLYKAQHQDALVKQLLNEVGKEISSILDLEPLLARIAVLTKKLIDYQVFIIGLLNHEKEEIELKVALGISDETRRRFHRIPLGRGVMSMAIRERRPIVIDDLHKHPTRIPVTSDTGDDLRSMIAVPLIFKHRARGVLAMQSTRVGFFRQEDVQTLTTLGNQIAAALENAKLFQELFRREQKLENNFQIARSMQLSMLPKRMPKVPGFEFATKYVPAGDLAGDLYDYVPLDGHHSGFWIGDVSGKGVSAALVMAACRSAMRFASREGLDPAEVLATTNRQLYRDIKNRFYVALFYGILSFEKRTFLWSNAGHHPPLRFCPDDTIHRLSTGGTVLGLFENVGFSAEETALEAGDTYLFYTDGVIEALNQAGEEFGYSRLIDVVIRNRGISAQALLDKIFIRLNRHTKSVEPHDDITLVILKCV